MDTSIWFPAETESSGAYERARRICKSCAVIEPCLELGLKLDGHRQGKDRLGMFGGLTGPERASLARRRAKGVA